MIDLELEEVYADALVADSFGAPTTDQRALVAMGDLLRERLIAQDAYEDSCRSGVECGIAAARLEMLDTRCRRVLRMRGRAWHDVARQPQWGGPTAMDTSPRPGVFRRAWNWLIHGDAW